MRERGYTSKNRYKGNTFLLDGSFFHEGSITYSNLVKLDVQVY